MIPTGNRFTAELSVVSHVKPAKLEFIIHLAITRWTCQLNNGRPSNSLIVRHC